MLNAKFISNILLVGCFLLAGIFTSAQNLTLDRFYGQLMNNRYYLSFTLASGFTCYGVIVERSTDGHSYEEIGKLNGWCGHISNSVSYQFIDANPVPNKTNFYRLQLGEEFNNRTTTAPIQFEYITYDNTGVTVLQGARNHLRIFIKPRLTNQIRLDIYDLTGTRLYQDQAQKNYYEVRLPFFSSKPVILRLTNKSAVLYSKKFMML